MNEVTTILLFVSSIVFIILSILVYFKYERSKSISAFSGFLLGVSLIFAIQGLMISGYTSISNTYLTRLGYIASVWTFSMLLIFSWYFPLHSNRTPKNIKAFWIVPLVFFFPFILFNPYFVTFAYVKNTGIYEQHGSLYWIFPLFVLVYSILTLINLFKSYQMSYGDIRKRIAIFTVLLLITFSTAVVFEALLPALGYPHRPISVFPSTILLASSFFIIIKK